ncbi:SDR family NAD(P)-dependent oxidoreductase [Gulosibacter faecalis]|jgi:3-oxoacyl-[acyl-carrier protein] reductase|uniref:SDR family NAD(P)-dependent oxidoreductase n=1 Tax=Gulosibacter faecalis TaxID=272240 RepID=A0ABW5V3L0_9MICO|nr:SDR family NAD(P)-dependent oxidoreductase [Gulosibacter faecalis]
MSRFADKTVVITGAAGGIGAALAGRLRAEGARLVLHDLAAEALASLDESLHAGADVHHVAGDITDPEVQAAIVRAAEELGGVDGFAPAAGIYLEAPLAELTLEQWRQTLAINLDAVFALTSQLLPVLNDDAAIVTFASVAGERGSKGHAHYAASKGAITSFTRTLALELGHRGIRANTVAPGIIRTRMTDGSVSKHGDAWAAQTPLGRHGTADETAAAVAFLLSSDASFITGVQLDVNGGLYMS